ncbi:LysR substrate-binding domain-containing protein, partial [Streptomyces acidiscabies]|uniref:LysR substrate-binding domain-containing protein n=1 Tax=Streptomyces acidiscabies TaxID=42234 RepID=UPI0038F7066F
MGLLMPDQAGSLHLLQTPIGTERILVVAKAHQHNLSDERSYRLSDLSHQPWFLNPVGCGCRAALLSTFDRLELPIQIA